MKKSALAVIICLALSACSKVPAGYRGVIVNLYGSDKGVNETSVGVGRYWVGMNEELFLFPTFLQNYTWVKSDQQDESITMQTSEGLSINTDAGITYQINPDNVVKVFQKYRLGINEITNTFLRNMVRDAMNQIASTMTVEEIYGSGKEHFMKSVNDLVVKEAADSGINIDKVYIVGTFRLPDSVENSINLKIQASQNAMQVENEVATQKAEAQKTIVDAQAEAQKILIHAKAQADANDILAKSITPQYLQYQAINKWDGKLPKVTSGATPFVRLQDEK